jgi:ribosomal protein S27E
LMSVGVEAFQAPERFVQYSVTSLGSRAAGCGLTNTVFVNPQPKAQCNICVNIPS